MLKTVETMWKLIFNALLFTRCSSEQVIIIGAGASAIATASKLLENNITDFKILEAQNRIGGRIHSVHLADGFVDLGAQFVHGEEGNIVFELAREYIKPGTDMNNTWVAYKGRKQTGENLVDLGYILKDEAKEQDGPYLSLGESFGPRYNKSVLVKYKNDPEMLEYALDYLRSAESFLIRMDGAYSWYNLSSTGKFVQFPGDRYQSWDGRGYKTILDILLKNFPNKTGYNLDNQLILNKSVLKIILKENSVNVKCKDGSDYSAEHVVFTPSLGVLKHDHDTIFQPKLSAEKVDAIENFGYEGAVKILFEFPYTWWGDGKLFELVWSKEDRKNIIEEIPYGPVKNGDHWLSYFIWLLSAPHNSKVLIGWLDGPMVPEVEKLSEAEIKTGTIFAMRKFLGTVFHIPDPIRIIHSKWHMNPNFRGGYSYETVAMKQKNIFSPTTTLQQPVYGKDGTPRILFAGEATHPTRYKTVDGAISSGFREANRLVKILKKSNAQGCFNQFATLAICINNL